MDYAALKTEITTDPTGLGYAAPWNDGSDWKVADIINRVRATITVSRQDIAPLEILEAIKITDFIGAANQTALNAAWFQGVTNCQSIRLFKNDGSDARALTNILGLLTAASASETRLRALATRTGSRAEQLFGVGTSVTTGDVMLARRV